VEPTDAPGTQVDGAAATTVAAWGVLLDSVIGLEVMDIFCVGRLHSEGLRPRDFT
jgi:hypothetical protein